MTIRFSQVVFDCRNAAALAAFYAEVLQQTVDPEANEFFATVGLRGDDKLLTGLMFIQVPEAAVGKNRLHIDLHSPTADDDVARAIGAGAERVGDFDEYGTRWTTLRDPEGNLFDIAQD